MFDERTPLALAPWAGTDVRCSIGDSVYAALNRSISHIGVRLGPVQKVDSVICNSCHSEIESDQRFEVRHNACAGDFPATRFAASQAHYLTARQREVLALVAWGYSNRKIAATLGIGQSTIEHHMADIFDALVPVSGRDYSRRVIAALTFIGGNGRPSAELRKVPMAATEDVPSPMPELIEAAERGDADDASGPSGASGPIG